MSNNSPFTHLIYPFIVGSVHGTVRFGVTVVGDDQRFNELMQAAAGFIHSNVVRIILDHLPAEADRTDFGTRLGVSMVQTLGGNPIQFEATVEITCQFGKHFGRDVLTDFLHRVAKQAGCPERSMEIDTLAEDIGPS
jgi:hypothetical protein